MDTPAPGTPSEDRRLLLVSRSAEARGSLKPALEARGFRVMAAPPGERVWAALTRQPPQLVIMDVMPGPGDPLEDLLRIKELLAGDRFVPVLALYPEKWPSHIVRGFRQGVDDFLVRPFELFELVLRLEVLWRIRRLQDEILSANRRLHALSIADDLTGLYNQREFKRRLSLELKRVERFGEPLSVIFFDCDHFKRVNDTCGHAVGSHVLKEVARIMVANLRELDIMCRYGGDEFVVALPACDQASGLEVAERLRGLVAMSTFRLGEAEVQITLSMGVAASSREHLLALDPLLQAADAALYNAKRTGRDRVCAHTPGAPIIMTPVPTHR